MIGWIDGQAGASGDMLLGALVDAGVPIEVMQQAIDELDLGIALVAHAVQRGGLGATKVDVRAPDTVEHRHLGDVLRCLEPLPAPVRELAAATFERLGAAEAVVHRVAVEQVHFHEVGALDALADIVGTAAGFIHLDLRELHCSTLSLGNGVGRGAHGPIPIPAPAVLELLGGVPVTAGPAPFESTTPTGAALLAIMVTRWGPLPEMAVSSAGYGAGSKDPGELVNALRLVLGEPVDAGSALRDRTAVQFDTNVDDLDPRVWPVAIAAILEAGAADAWLTPISMKKGRPAFMLSVLCSHSAATGVRAQIYAQTSTIGVRESTITKHALDRAMSTVSVDGQPIRVKTASGDGVVLNRSVEWEDVLAAARALGRSPKQVLADATGLAAGLDGS